MCYVGEAEAVELLKRNTRNRRASATVIERYATEMRRDEWMPTASGIGFDDHGVLLDGQQRLMAITSSKKTVQMLLVTHLPPRSQEKVDRQRRRTLFDIFSMFEEVSCRQAVQIATFLANLSKRANNANPDNVYGIPADSEVRDCLLLHNDALEVIAPMGRKREHGITRVGVLSAVTLAFEKYGDEAKEFYESVRSETHIDRTSPCLRLRSTLLTGKTNYGGWQLQFEDFQRTCYAFNAYHKGIGIAAVYRSEGIE
jgi:hypothetical protein